MDGFAFLHAFRDGPGCRDIPVWYSRRASSPEKTAATLGCLPDRNQGQSPLLRPVQGPTRHRVNGR